MRGSDEMVRCIAWLFLLCLLPLPALADAMIRIAVLEGASSVRLQGAGLRSRPLTEVGDYADLPRDTVRITRSGEVVALDGAATGAAGLRLRADGPIAVEGKSLRGSVEVLATGKGLLVVNELPIEAYLAAVLGSEMPPSFEPEALRAQAVAARTYAIGKKIAKEGEPFHLGATVLSQVYGGVHREDPRTKAAVEATHGQVLVFRHAPAEAYFFASCGGSTEEGGEALGRPLPYLTSHECPEHESTPGARWTLRLPAKELARRLNVRDVRDLDVTSRTGSGRARTVSVDTGRGTRRFTAVELRRLVGYGALKSLAFEVERRGGAFHFEGRGNGHGAGLCQWGAQAAAKDGWDHRRILGHYYPGTEIVPMY